MRFVHNNGNLSAFYTRCLDGRRDVVAVDSRSTVVMPNRALAPHRAVELDGSTPQHT